MAGTTYTRARWEQGYPGVIAQYRENVRRDARHLFVLGDGTWVIDHIDSENPDLGNPFLHFLDDHPGGQLVKGAAAMAAGIGLLVLAGKLIEEVLSEA